MAILSVTVPDSAVSRIRQAVGTVLGSTTPATVAQVQDLCRTYLRSLCLQVERVERERSVSTGADLAVSADFSAST